MAGKRLKVSSKGGSVDVRWRPEPAFVETHRLAERRGEAVGQFIVGQVKRVLSRGAPSVRLTASGRLVATTPARQGAAPRLVSGRLRNSIRHEVVTTPRAVVVRIVAASIYARALELGDPERNMEPHPFLRSTVLKNARKIILLFGNQRRGGSLKRGRKR